MVRQLSFARRKASMAVLLLCLARALTAVESANAKSAFMAEVSLNITMSIPVELASEGVTSVYGRQALTAVFSRPVISLGSDFNGKAAQQQAPLRLTCPMPGKVRWVTTTIARFDPDIDWPTDVDCDLVWNSKLTSYDGVKLQLGGVPARRRITSNGLSMYTGGITSELASNVTGGQWDANMGALTDKLPEAPPDGKLSLYFNNLVHLRTLASALKLFASNASGETTTPAGPSLPFTLGPCYSAAPWVTPTVPLSLDVNSTCAEVTVGASLERDTWYRLSLPSGSRYHAMSGPTHYELSTAFAGVRPFRLPFLNAFDPAAGTPGGVSYRRLDLWLPHGLAPGTTADDLARRISLCELSPDKSACTPRPFSLSLVTPAAARMVVPQLTPGRNYSVKVAADPTIKDGFGLGLQASAATFTANFVPYDLAAPILRGGAKLAVMEAGVDTLAAWPYITRAPPPTEPAQWPDDYSRSISSFVLDVSKDSDVMRLMRTVSSSINYNDPYGYLGKPSTSLLVPSELTTPGSGAGWREVQLPLGSAGLQIAHDCCDPYSSPSYGANTQILLRTSIAVSVLQSGPRLVAWVTDTSLRGGAGPVGRANVSFYGLPYYSTDLPYLVSSCSTDAAGVCVVDLSGAQAGVALATLVTAPPVGGASDPRVALLPSSGYTRQAYMPAPLLSKLVLDRLIVTPGDSVKVTGFVQLSSPSGLALPPTSYAVLAVSPSWYPFDDSTTATADQPPQRFLVVLNGTTGTLHGEVPVPKDARLQHYSINLYLPPSGSSKYTAQPNGRLPSPPSGLDSDGLLDDWSVATSIYFYAGDPRPPTAELLLEAPAWSLPNGTVVVNATAVSYIGASLAGAPMSLAWSTSLASGNINMTTDASGFASAAINLGALPARNRTTTDGVLYVNVQWIGPTRERITQSATIRLLIAPLSLSLTRSLDTDIPGVPFALAATLTSSVDGSEVPGLPVTVTLRPDPNNTAGAPCTTTTTCALTSGASLAGGGAAAPPCRMALPCVGAFELLACADVPQELRVPGGPNRVCSPPYPLGRNLTQWAASPLAAHDRPGIVVDKPDGYLLGESPKLYVENPFANARLLVVWGNDYDTRTLHVPSLAPGVLAEVSLGPIGRECLGGCSLVAVLDVPRAGPGDAPALPPLGQLPRSVVFDPAAPHSHTMYGGLQVLSTEPLEVEVAAVGGGGGSVQDASGEEVVAIEPGATAQISVHVGSAPSDGPVEVTVYAVDQAFLDMVAYELPGLQEDMLMRLYSSISMNDMLAYRLAPGAVRTVYDKLMSRLTTLDPWLPLDTDVGQGPGYGSLAVDTPDELYLSRYSSPLTYLPGMSPEYLPGQNAGSPPLMPSRRSPQPGPSGDTTGTGGIDVVGPSSEADGDVRSAADFMVTPLFAVAIAGRDGIARVNFTAPKNLGSFAIRAFAAAGATARYGAGEGKVVVRRRLSLTASVPRFVRVGDSFEAGVLVTVGSAPAAVSVTIKIQDPASSPLSAAGALTRTVSFKAATGLQQEVRFAFKAVGMGPANLTFSASDGQPGGGRDALSLELSVAAPQGDVWVATSFALAANGSVVRWQEGVELPDAVPGSGGLTLTAGVGNFPALSVVYGNLLQGEADRQEPYAPPALLWAVLTPLLTYYGQRTSAAQDTAITSAFADLSTLTGSQYGLMWSDPARWLSYYPQRADMQLSLWALFLVGLQSSALRPSPSSPLPSSLEPHRTAWADLEDRLVPAWREALGRQLLRDAAESLSTWQQPYSDWNTLAWARLALGASWVVENYTTNYDVRDALSLQSLLAAYRNRTVRAGMSRETRVVLSLALLGMGSANPLPSAVSATLTEVTSALRVQGRTAYVATAPGSSSPAALDEQALCLLLLLRSGSASVAQLLPKLAASLASNPGSGWGRGGGVYFSASWNSQGVLVAALAEYDRSRGSSKPTLNLTANANGLAVLRASFRTGNTRPVTNTTLWEDLPAAADGTPGELNFQVSGRGEVSVAASLHFVPAALLASPTYRGLYVEATLQLVDPVSGRPAGRPLAAVPLSSLVVLTVQITSPDNLGAVTLSVMMPGGLEPLDPELNADISSGCVLDWVDSYSWSRFYRWWWWPICPAQETRPAVVTFFYAALRSGTSSVTITAIAASAGTFVMPPVRAYVEQQPELMGSTAAGSITVCSDCAGPTYAKPPPLPKACPGACSDNGACDVRTGLCSCDEGFSGADCGRVVA